VERYKKWTVTDGTETNNYIKTFECSLSPQVIFIKLYDREEEYGYGAGIIPIPLENLTGQITLSNKRYQSFRIQQLRLSMLSASSLTNARA
jgi:hypothetical protein